MRRFPSAFSYVGYIRRRDGVFGLYRGLTAKLVENAVGCLVSEYVMHAVRPAKTKRVQELDLRTVDIRDYAVHVLKEGVETMVARSAGLFFSQPFYVISLRALVQFVGQETMYNGIFSSIREILWQEGVTGFYSGFIPRLIYELSVFWIAHTVRSVVELLVARFGDNEEKEDDNDGSQYQFHFVASFLGSLLAYPIQLVATLMSVNNCGLEATQPPVMPVFAGVCDCWSYLRSNNMMRRGSSIFVRSVQ